MDKIKRMRIKRGLTQMQLSQLSGLSQAYINELENGRKSNPSIIVLDKLAAALQVQISDILEDEGSSIAEIARNIDKW
jgi:XRE family transcriptional regulator, master regulator for biofilm formation